MTGIGQGGGLPPTQNISATAPVTRGDGSAAAALAKLPSGAVITGLVQGRDMQGHTLLDTPQGSLRIQPEPSLAKYLMRGTEVLLRIENTPKQVQARILAIDGKPLSKLDELNPLDAEDVVEESLKPLPNAPARPAPLATYSHLRPNLLPNTPLGAQPGPAPTLNAAAPATPGAPTAALPAGTPITFTLPTLTPQQAQILLQLSPALGELTPLPTQGQSVTLQLRVVTSQLPAPAFPQNATPTATAPNLALPSTPTVANPSIPQAVAPNTTLPTPGTVSPAVVPGTNANPGPVLTQMPNTAASLPQTLPLTGNTTPLPQIPGTPQTLPLQNNITPQAVISTARTSVQTPTAAPANPALINRAHLPGEPLLLGTVRVMPESALNTFNAPTVASPSNPAAPQASPTPMMMDALSRLVSVLETPLGPLRLPPTLPALPPGTQLALEVVRLTPQGQIPTTDIDGSPMPLPELASRWQSLEEAVHQLQLTGQEQPLKQLLDQLPQAGPRLASSTLFFMAVLGRSAGESWLPPQVTAALERAGHGRLAQRIDQEFGSVRQLFTDSAQQPWQATLVPVLDEGQVRPARFYRRRERGEEGSGEERSLHERFVIEINLSQFGPMQLDGLYRQSFRLPSTDGHPGSTIPLKQFALLIRSHTSLPDDVRMEVGNIFRATLESLGIAGTLGFDVAQYFPEFGANNALARLHKDVEV